jgi:hypothetical protein
MAYHRKDDDTRTHENTLGEKRRREKEREEREIEEKEREEKEREEKEREEKERERGMHQTHATKRASGPCEKSDRVRRGGGGLRRASSAFAKMPKRTS